MAKAVIITTEGEKKVAEFQVGESYKLLSETVGGLIECVRLAPNLDMWVNDNGLAEGLAQNPHGTALYVDTFNYPNVIVGNIIFTGGADEEGETLGLTDEQVTEWLNYDKRLFHTPIGFVEYHEIKY